MRDISDAAAFAFFLLFFKILNKSGCKEKMEVLIICVFTGLAYRAKPNSKDVLPKGISVPETELPESKLCKVASSKLQKTLPDLWRQVFCSHTMKLSLHVAKYSLHVE